MSERFEYPPFEVDQHLTARSQYYAGKIGSLFFTTLRDEHRILGIHCAKCAKSYYPPRSTCGRCFAKLSESDLVEIGPEGTLETFTQVHYSERIHPVDVPFIYGVIKLDGADTSIAHLLGEVDLQDIKIGMRVRAVFAQERQANILAIRYFKPV